MILIPWLWGEACIALCYGRDRKQNLSIKDAFLIGWILEIALAEAAQLLAVLFGQSFSACVSVFVAELAVCSLLSALFLAACVLTGKRKGTRTKPAAGALEKLTQKETAAALFAVFLAVLQGLLILFGEDVYLTGDMTCETVQSFLATDKVYGVNPLTGMEYVLGMPLRYRILCLPFFYGAVSKIWGVAPVIVIQKLVPLFVLFACYLVYSILGEVVFAGKRLAKYRFLALIAVLLFVEDTMYGLDGFGLLHRGFAGVTIRAAVLIPYTFSLILRRKWALCVLCILAEACIVWTLYGLGMCFLIVCLMALAARLWRLQTAHDAGRGAMG